MKLIKILILTILILYPINFLNAETIGGEKDEYGCLIGAGYFWCEKKQKCLRSFEEECDSAVGRDDGGDYRISTFGGEQYDPEFPYIMITRVFDGEVGEIVMSEVFGYVDNAECGSRFYALLDVSQALADTTIEIARKIFGNQYTISVAFAICHPNWYCIYMHDGEHWAPKEAYDKLWKKLNG